MVLYYDCGDSWSLPCHLPCHPIFLSFRLTFFVPHVGAETITNGIPIDFLFQILFRVTSQCLPQIEEVRSGKGRGRGPNSQSVALAVSIWTEFLWEVWELPLGLRLLWPEGRWSTERIPESSVHTGGGGELNTFRFICKKPLCKGKDE